MVWHAFFGVPGAQNDFNVLHQSPVFNQVLRGETNQITYTINNIVYEFPYYLADEIYPQWTTFVKIIQNPQTEKEAHFFAKQEGYRKMWRGVLVSYKLVGQSLEGFFFFFDQKVLRSIMMTCIILHNMIVKDEYDSDAKDEYGSDDEQNQMNTRRTRIYNPHPKQFWGTRAT